MDALRRKACAVAVLTVRGVAMADFRHGLNRVRELGADMLEV